MHIVQGRRRVWKSGGLVLGGDNVFPLVQIGLTDLLKTGGAIAPPASPLATGLEFWAKQAHDVKPRILNSWNYDMNI